MFMIPPTRLHHVQAIPDRRGFVPEDSEDYLFLDEEEEATPKVSKERLTLPKIGFPSLSKSRIDTSEEIEEQEQDWEDGFEISLDGTHNFDWGIRGMDCPDCAMKAKRAVNRLPGVESCRISVSDGTVEVSQDISSELFAVSFGIYESQIFVSKIFGRTFFG